MLLKVEGCHDAFGALCTADAQPNQGNLEVDQFKARLQANADQGIYTTTIGQSGTLHLPELPKPTIKVVMPGCSRCYVLPLWLAHAEISL